MSAFSVVGAFKGCLLRNTTTNMIPVLNDICERLGHASGA